jgi:UDP-N-acetylglucosamine 2-epimerase (non-hydrolysing)
MLAQALAIFDLVPDHSLDVMRPDQSLAGLTSRLAAALDPLLAEVSPDLGLVQGDTTTTFASALACFYRRIPVGHVEAGLRTGDFAAPFPEEGNRRLVSAITRLHFAPTEGARLNLLREGIPAASIEVTGNTVVDALVLELELQRRPGVGEELREALSGELGARWWESPIVLITGHRRENFGEGFEEICGSIAELAAEFPDHRFVYPVHLNPNVQEPVRRHLGALANVRLIPPQGYREFVALMRECRLVLTDSGGVQEEAPSLGKPVLVLREITERPEGVAAGTVRLVGARRASIVSGVRELLTSEPAYRRMAEATNPYGDGRAAARIRDAILRLFGGDLGDSRHCMDDSGFSR